MELEGMIEDTRIKSMDPLPSPRQIREELPLSALAGKNVFESRETIKNILDGKDKKRIIIAGPCSIHDPASALEYAKKLKKLAEDVSDVAYIVMRTYLEKPRTVSGWKGPLYDPNLDNSGAMSEGISTCRELLLKINELGLPCANEFVNTYFPQYITDLISWCAIGARSVEYQGLRELASGLSMPVGFKNSTSGDIELAVNSCRGARIPQFFPGMNKEGKISRLGTMGNEYVHVVLRGGNGLPNYHPESVEKATKLMLEAGLRPNILVDCSHANSSKQYEKQEEVAYEVLKQIKNGAGNIVGIMLESNLFEGQQPFPENEEQRRNLKYGISITDSCIPPETTERIIREYANVLREMKKAKA